MRAWRTAYASAAGTSHGKTGDPCQDAGRCEVVRAGDGSEVLLASVADGAGSASRSEQGAELAVAAFHDAFAEAAREEPSLTFLDHDRAHAWLAQVQASIAALAIADGGTPRDYACTFLGAVIGPTSAAFLQIGDGAIVVGDTDGADEGHTWVFWPQHGEFANSTFFVTMADAADFLQFERREITGGQSYIRELAMFSDGLERLILDMKGRTVYSPSLRPILNWLAGTAPSFVVQPSEVLRAYLTSANVNRRTDDDKTLVLATRSEPSQPVASV